MLSSGAIQVEADGQDVNFGNFSSDAGDGSITFPVLTNPMSLIGLMFGQSVTLVKVVSPELVSQASFDLEIPVWDPPPITVDLEGSIGIDARFTADYDTYGIVEAASYISGGGSSARDHRLRDLLDGLYFDDTPTLDQLGVMEPATSISVYGSVSVGASAGYSGVLAAGVGGGVTLNISMSLKDNAPPNLESAAYLQSEQQRSNKTRVSRVRRLGRGVWRPSVRVQFEWLGQLSCCSPRRIFLASP